MQTLPKVIAVVGTTASGKSDLAIQLAQQCNGEIVSVDSRQIYAEMDIGTNKEPGEIHRIERPDVSDEKFADSPVSLRDVLSAPYISSDILHYFISIVRPDQTLTLAHIQQLAFGVIDDILKRGKLPILVGGTGLYTSAILENWQLPKGLPDPKLREELQALSIDELQHRLQKLDPLAYDSVDRLNPRRLIRAIEMALQGQGYGRAKRGAPRYEALYLAPLMDKEAVSTRIDSRVDAMVKAGLIEEVKRVGGTYGYDSVAMTGHAYQQIGWYLQGKISLEEAIELSKKVTRAYAKRQRTWWKKFGNVQWVKDATEALQHAKRFLRRA